VWGEGKRGEGKKKKEEGKERAPRGPPDPGQKVCHPRKFRREKNKSIGKGVKEYARTLSKSPSYLRVNVVLDSTDKEPRRKGRKKPRSVGMLK